MSRGLAVMLTLVLAAWVTNAVASVSPVESTPAQHFAQGNIEYQEGRYSTAADQYAAVVALGYESPALYLNQGNALLLDQRLGEAIVAYSRGLRLDPRDRALVQNLAYARSLTVDATPDPGGSPFLEVLAGFVRSVSAREAIIWGALLYWLLLVVVVVIRLVPALRRPGQVALWVVGTALVLVSALAVSRTRADWANDRAVIITDAVEVRTGPGESYKSRFTLHEGTTVEVRRRSSAWYEVELTAELVGWVPTSTLMNM